MYRAKGELSAAEAPPNELVYEAIDPEGRRGSSVAMFQIFSVPPLVAVVLSMLATPEVGLFGLVASALGAVWWWRRPRTHGYSIRVSGGDVTVSARASARVLVSIPLGDLLDVTLDTKTIQRIQEGSSAIPAVRFQEAQVGPALDTSRVVLVSRQDAFVPLGDTYLANMHATEWLGKIRVFLRKHGWVPEAERDAGPPSPRDPERDFA